jgi:hypothetical protein
MHAGESIKETRMKAISSIDTSPQLYARTAGALYLIIIALGIFGEAFARGRIVVSGDPLATATNLVSMEPLWRWGIASEFLTVICTIILAMVYFFLLRPVSREINLLAAFFRLTAITVQAVSLVYLLTALYPLTNAAFAKAFTPDELNAFAGVAIRSHSYGYGAALLFTGCTFLFHGYLIFKSGYLPRVLGVMIQIAGIGYITNTFAMILFPAVSNIVFLVIILPVFMGELSLSLWLLIKGVNLEKWYERARPASTASLAG